MKKLDIPYYIPSLDEMNSTFKKFFILNIFSLTVIIIIDIYLLYDFIFKSDIGFKIFYVFNLIISLLIFSFQYKLIFFQKKQNLRKMDNDNKLGKFTGQEIKKLSEELFEKFNLREIPNIYIVNSKDAGVFVLDSLFFNFIKPVNALYISKILFYILKKDEIKAIIAHELAHFKKYIYPLQRTRIFYYLLLGLFPVYSIKLFNISGSLTFALACYLIIFIFNWLFGILVFSKSKTLEYLSDYTAAKNYGKINFINALFIVAKITEISELMIEILLKRINKNDKLSIKNLHIIMNEIQSKFSDKIVTKDELKKMIDNYLRTKGINKFKRKLKYSEIINEEAWIYRTLAKFVEKKYYNLIDWNLFDFSPKDNRINKKEYPYLINTLIENPRGQLFNLILDNKNNSYFSVHPTIRERILFIEKSIAY